LKEVEITIYCLDSAGKTIFEKFSHPVFVSNLGLGGSNQPLTKAWLQSPIWSEARRCTLGMVKESEREGDFPQIRITRARDNSSDRSRAEVASLRQTPERRGPSPFW
jgi:hypothetical protein